MEVLTDPWNYITALINYMSLLVHMDIFGRPRSWYKKDRRITGDVFFYLILILIPDLGMWENVVMMSLWAGFAMLCTHRFTVLWALLHGFLWNSIGAFCEFFTASLMNLCMDEKMIFSPYFYHMGQVMSNLLLLFIILEIRRIIGRGQRNPDRETGIAIAVLCTFILMISYSVSHIAIGSSRRSDRYICILINALLLFIAFGIVRFYSKLSEHSELERKKELYKKQAEIYQEQAKEYESTMAEFQKTRHDRKNHMIYLEGLIKAGKIQEAEAYIRKLREMSGRAENTLEIEEKEQEQMKRSGE
ncbi:hypothetical protein [Blautia sp.]|uniref:Uncharacterized protein n=1 Tax=Blautia glucerasea TaxID=536633 RepID=A0A6N2VLT1_9FIRM